MGGPECLGIICRLHISRELDESRGRARSRHCYVARGLLTWRLDLLSPSAGPSLCCHVLTSLTDWTPLDSRDSVMKRQSWNHHR